MSLLLLNKKTNLINGGTQNESAKINRIKQKKKCSKHSTPKYKEENRLESDINNVCFPNTIDIHIDTHSKNNRTNSSHDNFVHSNNKKNIACNLPPTPKRSRALSLLPHKFWGRDSSPARNSDDISVSNPPTPIHKRLLSLTPKSKRKTYNHLTQSDTSHSEKGHKRQHSLGSLVSKLFVGSKQNNSGNQSTNDRYKNLDNSLNKQKPDSYCSQNKVELNEKIIVRPRSDSLDSKLVRNLANRNEESSPKKYLCRKLKFQQENKHPNALKHEITTDCSNSVYSTSQYSESIPSRTLPKQMHHQYAHLHKLSLRVEMLDKKYKELKVNVR